MGWGSTLCCVGTCHQLVGAKRPNLRRPLHIALIFSSAQMSQQTNANGAAYAPRRHVDDPLYPMDVEVPKLMTKYPLSALRHDASFPAIMLTMTSEERQRMWLHAHALLRVNPTSRFSDEGYWTAVAEFAAANGDTEEAWEAFYRAASGYSLEAKRLLDEWVAKFNAEALEKLLIAAPDEEPELLDLSKLEAAPPPHPIPRCHVGDSGMQPVPPDDHAFLHDGCASGAGSDSDEK